MSAPLTGLSFCDVKLIPLQISEENGFLPVNDEIVIDALEYMLGNIHEHIKIRDIAKRYYISEDVFIRRFSKVMSITPYAWLKNIRLKTARSLLDNRSSLTAAAAAVGYSDASALLHALKRQK